MENCKKCGKKVSKKEISKNYGRCQNCFREECSEYEYWKARQLSSADIINKKVNKGKICGECYFSKTKQNAYSDSNICSKFQINITLRQDFAETCPTYITESDYEKKSRSRQVNTEEASSQIIIDFSTLKDVMKKNGISITTYECPNCKGTVKIPEAGNIIICQYCRTTIRPMEIFKKIKDLIQ